MIDNFCATMLLISAGLVTLKKIIRVQTNLEYSESIQKYTNTKFDIRVFVSKEIYIIMIDSIPVIKSCFVVLIM